MPEPILKASITFMSFIRFWGELIIKKMALIAPLKIVIGNI